MYFFVIQHIGNHIFPPDTAVLCGNLKAAQLSDNCVYTHAGEVVLKNHSYCFSFFRDDHKAAVFKAITHHGGGCGNALTEVLANLPLSDFHWQTGFPPGRRRRKGILKTLHQDSANAGFPFRTIHPRQVPAVLALF